MKWITIFLSLTTLVVIFGCTNKVDRSAVIGTYYARYNNAVETLELKTDGTYNYYFKSPSNFEIKHSNKWDFEYANGEPMLTFEEFV